MIYYSHHRKHNVLDESVGFASSLLIKGQFIKLEFISLTKISGRVGSDTKLHVCIKSQIHCQKRTTQKY